MQTACLQTGSEVLPEFWFLYPNMSVFDLDRISRDGICCREASDLSGADVKPGAMPGALDLVIQDVPIFQTAAVMGAEIGDAIEHAFDVEDYD
jgi:hypothetical protein